MLDAIETDSMLDDEALVDLLGDEPLDDECLNSVTIDKQFSTPEHTFSLGGDSQTVPAPPIAGALRASRQPHRIDSSPCRSTGRCNPDAHSTSAHTIATCTCH